MPKQNILYMFFCGWSPSSRSESHGWATGNGVVASTGEHGVLLDALQSSEIWIGCVSCWKVRFKLTQDSFLSWEVCLLDDAVSILIFGWSCISGSVEPYNLPCKIQAWVLWNDLFSIVDSHQCNNHEGGGSLSVWKESQINRTHLRVVSYLGNRLIIYGALWLFMAVNNAAPQGYN